MEIMLQVQKLRAIGFIPLAHIPKQPIPALDERHRSSM